MPSNAKNLYNPCPQGMKVPMELRHLRYFVSVAETASVSKAALRVHISQPALSRQIRDLETELGLRLFDRVGRRIRLTAEGQDLLERSRDVLARADAIGERARDLTTGAAGRLRVGATPQTMQSVIAGFLARYRRSRPGVEVILIEAGGVRLLDLAGARGRASRRGRHPGGRAIRQSPPVSDSPARGRGRRSGDGRSARRSRSWSSPMNPYCCSTATSGPASSSMRHAGSLISGHAPCWRAPKCTH